VVNIHALIAEILGVDATTAEDGTGLADLSEVADYARPFWSQTGRV
jgi:hypothetical protein